MSETTKKQRTLLQWCEEKKNPQGHGERQRMEQPQSEGNRIKEHEERRRVEQPQQQREEKIRKEHEEQQQLEDEQQDELDALCQKQKAIKKKREELEKEQRNKEEQLRKIQRALDEQGQLEEELNNQRSELIIRQRLERKKLKEKQLKRKRYAPSSQYIKTADSDRDGRSCASTVSPSRKREDEEERRGQLSIIQAKEQSDVPKTSPKKKHRIRRLSNTFKNCGRKGISSRSSTWSTNDLRKQETFHKSPSLATTSRDSAATLTGDENNFGSKFNLDDVLEGQKQEYMTHHQKKTKKHQKLTRDDISGPSDFRHIDHIGPEDTLDPKISPRTSEICEKAQVTEEQLKDPKTAKFIHEFVEANSPENPDHASRFTFRSEDSKSKVKNKMSLEEKDKMKIKWSEQKRSEKHREKLQSLLEERTETRRLGPLRVCFDQEFLIGRGSCGTLVYAGFYKDGSEVAVKRLVRNATAEALFMENEKEISQLVEDRNSENIVRYRRFERAQNFAYIVLDLCEQNLANYVKSNTEEYLQRHGPRIIKEILTGLLVLHSGTRIVLHMDLKPENILVDWEDRMRLADFGISREVREGNTTVDTGQQKGTDGWTAVECIKREGTERLKPSRKSDIQVVGMISFYVLTKGEHLFGKTIDRTHNIINGNPVDLEKLTDDSARDFVSLLIRHKKDERPYAEEALNHPYLTF